MGTVTLRTRLKVVIVRRSNNQIIFEKTFSSFPIVFGRGDQCHIPLPKYQSLSRNHGSITIEDDLINIFDLNSTNGIFVNQERMAAFALKKEGKFVVGELVFFVRIEKANMQVPIQRISPPSKNSKNANGVAKESKNEVETADLDHLTKSSVRLARTAQSLKLERNVDLSAHSKDDLALQGIVTWGEEIFDVRQFINGDKLIAGSDVTEPVYVPTMKSRTYFGQFNDGNGNIVIPGNIKWRLQYRGYDFDSEIAVKKKLAVKNPNGSFSFRLGMSDLCTIDLGDEMSLHVRYVEIPRPLITRTWIENREEFKKAIRVSLALHLVFCVAALLSTPKPSGPKVENIPQRFAKLLVEPPSQMLAAPPAPPPVAEKKPEPPPPPPPPKPIPEPPKPKVVEKKIEPPKIKKVVKVEPKPAPKPQPKPEVQAKPEPVKAPPANVTTPPKPGPKAENNSTTVAKEPPKAAPQPAEPSAEQMANSFANAFSTAPAPKAGVQPNIKIGNQAGPSAGNPKISNLVSDLKNGAGQGGSSSNLDTGPSLGKKVGQQSYAGTAGGVAGKRAVGGAVLGTPKFESPKSPQGLSNDEVMKTVNKHLSEIHRCYERALFQDSNLVGRAEYEWNIDPNGSVSDVSVKRSDMSGADFLNNCVVGVFKKMKFPAAANKMPTTANIGFPFGKN